MEWRMNGDHAAAIYDVIIVGAGPTGLALANLLGKENVSVLLLEKNSQTVQEPRAVSIDDESLRTIQAIGLIDIVMNDVVPGYGSRYLSPDGRCFLTVMPKEKPYGFARRNAFRQPILEQQLRDGLARYSSVETRFESTLTDFKQDAEGVEVQFKHNDQENHVRGRFLVGADGASSLTRKKLGFDFEGKTLPERWLIIDLADSPAERDTVVFCDIARPCIALPGPNQTRRFEFKLFDNESEQALLQPGKVQELLRWRGAAADGRIVRQTVYTFHARIVARWREGRIFLAGDAAHLTPPFAGQGMNSGIRDAHNLSWKLAAVLRGQLSPDILESYEQERRGHVASMIDLALRMGKIMGPSSRMRGWLTQNALRMAGLWPPLRSYFGEMKYKPRPYFKAGFLVPSDNPLVGRLLPQPHVVGSSRNSLLDDEIGYGFVLLGIDVPLTTVQRVVDTMVTGDVIVRPVSLSLAGDKEIRATGPELLLLDPTDPGLLAAAGCMLLVRPDRYVMAVFREQDVATLTPTVEALFGRRKEMA
jgi:3-(3-hydroxy-phenyl)propionate hydroxylase